MVPGTASDRKLQSLHQPVESLDAGGCYIRIAKSGLVLWQLAWNSLQTRKGQTYFIGIIASCGKRRDGTVLLGFRPMEDLLILLGVGEFAYRAHDEDSKGMS
jgi:hypothetical protein